MDIERIRQEKEQWAKHFGLDGLPPVRNHEGIEVEAVYTPADIADTDFMEDIGFPGGYPFTRGPYPEMCRRRPWRFAILSGFGTPEDTNVRWKFLYQGGQRSFTWVPDLPTQAGLDSDDPRAESEVGLVGMAVDTARDLEIAYGDLPVEQVPFSPNVEGTAPQILALHIAAAEKLGADRRKLKGTVANDPLLHSIGKGYFLWPLKGALRLATDVSEFCIKELPSFFPTNLKGAGDPEMTGWCFASAILYIEEVLKRGINIDEFAPKITFFAAVTEQIFEQVAKLRASRRVWARLMKERFKAQNPASMAFRFTAYIPGDDCQVEWPELNIARAAFACFAGAMGGCQGMLLPAWDEPFAIPSERSHGIALGTQQIVAEEIGVTKTVDPLGGSYYIEALTNRAEKQILNAMKYIEDSGGPIRAIEDGYMQKRNLDKWLETQRQIASGEKVVVRRNKYRIEEGVNREIELQTLDTGAGKRKIEGLKKFKAEERDNTKVEQSLQELHRATAAGENVMPYLVEAAKAYASIGEMTKTLKGVVGDWKEPKII